MTRPLCLLLLMLLPVSAGAGRAQAADPLASVDSLIEGGKYAEAEKAARDALTRVEAAEGPDSAAAAHVLNRLCDVLLRQGRSGSETEGLLARALRIEEKTEPASRQLAMAIRNQAWLLEARGEFEPSRAAYARALETLRAALGPDNRETLLMQKDLAMAWNNLGEYGKARELLEGALQARLKQDPDHVDVAVLRHNLGAVYWQLGEYAAARDAFTAASQGLARALGDSHPHVATSLEGLAVVQVAFGEYAEARSTYRRVLAMREKALPPGHPMIGQTYVNLGDVLMSMGDYPAARQALERSLAILEKALGPDHPQLLAPLTNLAVLRQRTGDAASARRALERGIRIREKANGKDDPDLVIPLTQLANLLADTGHMDTARGYYARARSLAARTRGVDHPYVASAELDEGLRLAARGRLTEAAPLIMRARAAREKILGREHPDVAAALDASARLAALTGNTSAALGDALDAEALARQHYQAAAALLPESQALQYAEGRARSQDLAIDLAVRAHVRDADTIARIWDGVVRSRALVLEEMSWRERVLMSSSQPAVRQAVDEAAAARARLAQLFLRGPSERPAGYARELTGAREAKDRADERLAAESAAYRRDRSRRASGFDAIRDALPQGAALVSFVRYEDRVISVDPRSHHFAYAAFVLPSRSSRPLLIPLGAAASLDALIGRWRQQVRAEATAPSIGAARRERAYRDVAASLRARVWDPVAARLEGAARVLIVPDAALHLVDFAALPGGGDRYLVETGPTLHYATAERDVIPDDSAPGSGLLAVGAPAFDRLPVVGASLNASRLRSDCPAAPGARFASLPESGREADGVARLWRTTGAGGGSLVLRGAEASESALKAEAPGRRVLHLATHGFVMGEGCLPSSTTGAAAALATNPLLGSGLVLAGASRRSGRGERPEDGILTAEEVSAMDLAGVEWAVLSACDSGTGLVRAGEGVFGLRRAFQIAGVRTVIMSLWPIDDRVARNWMASLYASRLERHRSTADAVRDASLAALSRRRHGGGSTHPLYWSGFVAAGDWR